MSDFWVAALCTLGVYSAFAGIIIYSMWRSGLLRSTPEPHDSGREGKS